MLDFNKGSDQLENNTRIDKIFCEQILLVEKNAKISNLVSLIISIVLATVLWPKQSHDVIATWLAYMVA